MATDIDIDTVVGGPSSGTPLTSAGITVGAGTEAAVTFSNWPNRSLTIVLDTNGADVTYGYATGETGGRINLGVPCLIESGGRPLFLNSAAGATVWIRVL